MTVQYKTPTTPDIAFSTRVDAANEHYQRGDIEGLYPHDAPISGSGIYPVLVGGYASTAAPLAVASGDAVKAWYLLDGSQVCALSAGSALIGGDASFGLDVDVIRLAGLSTAALSDNLANPTTLSFGSFPHVWDGTDWSRLAESKHGIDTPGTGIVAVGLMGEFDDSSTSTVTENQFAPIRISSRRAMRVEGVTSGDPVLGVGYFVTVSTDVTRPADTTAYAVGDALSDSTSAPTSGGFTFTSAARTSGGSGIITDAIITTAADAATLLQGEIWLFNQAVTNINDNAAFAVSDAEIKTCVGKIPFTLEDAGNNGFYHAQNLNIGFTCSGTANLRFLVKVKNAYTPISAEVFTFVLKILQTN